ncbi:MAG: CBS domain-containing protein [Gemmatimonadota bacterium]
MRVRDVLKEKAGGDVVTIRPSADVERAAELLMRRGIGGLPVVDPDGSLLGFVSERDIVRLVHEGRTDLHRLTMAEVMSRPAPVCEPDAPLTGVMSRMTRERLRHLVVVEGGRIEGILSVGDLVKHRIRELETEAGVLRDYVAGQRARR